MAISVSIDLGYEFEVKAKYDPRNVFKRNQNIVPA